MIYPYMIAYFAQLTVYIHKTPLLQFEMQERDQKYIKNIKPLAADH